MGEEVLLTSYLRIIGTGEKTVRVNPGKNGQVALEKMVSVGFTLKNKIKS